MLRSAGSPVGSFVILNGVNVYTAIPSQPTPKKAILMLPDVFGVELKNNQLITDVLAKKLNISTYLIDYLNGDAVSEAALSGNSDFSMAEWKKNHGPEKTRPPLDQVIEFLKNDGVTDFAAVGYCFGKLAFGHLLGLQSDHISLKSLLLIVSSLQVASTLLIWLKRTW